ncbi:hypothetical protein BGZ54_000743 [Gamsiella multidivaricata]|nr:hypothetical protein BGZ54_000743 [Gamsiella multidivaricata]
MPSPKRAYSQLLSQLPTYQAPLEILREMVYLVHESKAKGKASQGYANRQTNPKRLSLDLLRVKVKQDSKREGIYIFPIFHKAAKRISSYDGTKVRGGIPKQGKASEVRPPIYGHHPYWDPVSSPKTMIKGANLVKPVINTAAPGEKPRPQAPKFINTAVDYQEMTSPSTLAAPQLDLQSQLGKVNVLRLKTSISSYSVKMPLNILAPHSWNSLDSTPLLSAPFTHSLNPAQQSPRRPLRPLEFLLGPNWLSRLVLAPNVMTEIAAKNSATMIEASLVMNKTAQGLATTIPETTVMVLMTRLPKKAMTTKTKMMIKEVSDRHLLQYRVLIWPRRFVQLM